MDGVMVDTIVPRRPLLKYHGGKWSLARWIISHMPEHRIYVEPFCGAASVLMRKPRAHGEIINDLDGEIVNLFQIVRTRGDEFARQIELSPWARDEYYRAYEPATDAMERARRLIIRSAMGFASNSILRKNGFLGRDYSSRGPTMTGWRRYPAIIEETMRRLQGVVLENLPAVDLIKKYDHKDVFFYCDPPYLMSTRQDSRKDYKHEMTEAEHVMLASLLNSIQGNAAISGYHSELYGDFYRGWKRFEHDAFTCHRNQRTEILWVKRQ